MKFLQFILLPFFPDNQILRKHWWHRLALVVSMTLSVLFITISLWIFYSFITPYNVKPENSQYKVSDTVTKRTVTITGSVPPTEKDAEEIFARVGLESSKSFTIQKIEKPFDFNWDLLKIAGIFILLAWGLPNLVYRVFLFIILGNKGKQ